MTSSERAGSSVAFDVRAHLLAGHVIPAHPLALTAARAMDERSQRALTRYYVAAGAGGMAVGVHTTGFPIHDVTVGLYEPVLALAAETAAAALAEDAWVSTDKRPASDHSAETLGRANTKTPLPRAFAHIAGLVGGTTQAVREAEVAHRHGYHCGLLSLGAWRHATESEILAHCREVARVIPLFGFYLQPAVGGRSLGYEFWRAFAEIPEVVAIKVAPFSRYATLDVLRAVADSGRRDIALYTGNDDAILADLVTEVASGDASPPTRFVGGLLGQWAVWTSNATKMLRQIQSIRASGGPYLPKTWLTFGAKLTEANAAIFDVRHDFVGCLPGILHVLQRQGLVQTTLTFDERETLSPGQRELIDAMCARFPELGDDAFVAANVERWRR
jgi:hypothetical protein